MPTVNNNSKRTRRVYYKEQYCLWKQELLFPRSRRTPNT